VNGQRPPLRPAAAAEKAGCFQVEDGRGQAVLEQERRSVGMGVAEQKNGSLNASPAQLQGLLEEGHGQVRGARPESGPGHGHGPVAVAVGFNHRHDLHIRPQQAAKFAHIVLNAVKVYLRPGWLQVKRGRQGHAPIRL